MSAPVIVSCAICSKPAIEKFKPFCSSRCATLDLGKWLGEEYKVPVRDEDLEDSVVLSSDGEE